MECQKGKASGTGSVDGIANGSPVGLSASGTGRSDGTSEGEALNGAAKGEGSGKETMKVECPKSGLLTQADEALADSAGIAREEGECVSRR